MKNFIKKNYVLVVMTAEIIVFFFASLLASVVFSNPELVAGVSLILTYTFYDISIKPLNPKSETKE